MDMTLTLLLSSFLCAALPHALEEHGHAETAHNNTGVQTTRLDHASCTGSPASCRCCSQIKFKNQEGGGGAGRLKRSGPFLRDLRARPEREKNGRRV